MVANEINQLKNRAFELHSRYEKYYPAAFFVIGFLFDVLTLDRIDSLFTILQQALYILIIGYILVYQTLQRTGHFQPPAWLHKAWQYNNEALHFLFGSLLSSYFLFYFVSSSLAVSFWFLAVMFGLLVANEFPQFQRKGPWLKFTLYAVCVFSFFSCLVPVALGFTNIVTLAIAIGLGLAMVYSLYRYFQKKMGVPPVADAAATEAPPGADMVKSKDDFNLSKNVLYPPMAVAALLLSLYFLKLLPPLPLSIQYMGIYHSIQRDGENYVLKYDRPWWRFWQNGAQTFLAQPGDKIVCFVRIFSPTAFKDRVVFHWQKYGGNGWETRDRIPNEIVGGRDAGFRGHTIKGNFEPGDWRVKVETLDGREIGRVSFTVVSVPPTPAGQEREFRVDRY